MALIRCPECGREISDRANSCPGCGCPMTPQFPDAQAEKLAAAKEKDRKFLLRAGILLGAAILVFLGILVILARR